MSTLNDKSLYNFSDEEIQMKETGKGLNSLILNKTGNLSVIHRI